MTVEPNLTTTRVVGYSAARQRFAPLPNRLTRARQRVQSFVTWPDKAEVEVATAEDGIKFPAYVVDGRRSVFHHMQELAALCGFDLYINAEGKLVFEKFVGGKTVHVFEFAKHIVALDVVAHTAYR